MATTLSPTPIYKGWGNDGAPLVGGKLFTYQAGTSTKLATYTDSTGGTPNANPIILNARGEAPVWIPPNVAYKYVLAPATDTDPPTNPIQTTDQITNAQLLTLYGGVDTGVVNAYVLTFSAQFTSYTDGIAIYWFPSHTNTGASTLNVNGIGVAAIVNQDLSALSANQLVANQLAFVIMKGGQFILSSILGSLGAGGILTVAGVNVTGSTIPANGLYLPAANTTGISSNTLKRLSIDANGVITIVTASAGTTLVVGGTAGTQTATIYEVLNTINAQKSVATYETGTFTGTLTGCTTAPTATFNWSRVGSVVVLDMDAGAFFAVSNSALMTVIGLPVALRPARAQGAYVRIQDNSVIQQGWASVAPASGLITFGVGSLAAGGFTAANNKGVGPSFIFTYNLT